MSCLPNHDSDASRHDDASQTIEAAYNGSVGRPPVSEYVYKESGRVDPFLDQITAHSNTNGDRLS